MSCWSRRGVSDVEVACLNGGRESCALDFFLDPADTKLMVKGNATVHLAGYYVADEGTDEEAKGDDIENKQEAKAEAKGKPNTDVESKAKAMKAKAMKKGKKAAAAPAASAKAMK